MKLSTIAKRESPPAAGLGGLLENSTGDSIQDAVQDVFD
jgi:hypothetical protein